MGEKAYGKKNYMDKKRNSWYNKGDLLKGGYTYYQNLEDYQPEFYDNLVKRFDNLSAYANWDKTITKLYQLAINERTKESELVKNYYPDLDPHILNKPINASENVERGWLEKGNTAFVRCINSVQNSGDLILSMYDSLLKKGKSTDFFSNFISYNKKDITGRLIDELAKEIINLFNQYIESELEKMGKSISIESMQEVLNNLQGDYFYNYIQDTIDIDSFMDKIILKGLKKSLSDFRKEAFGIYDNTLKEEIKRWGNYLDRDILELEKGQSTSLLRYIEDVYHLSEIKEGFKKLTNESFSEVTEKDLENDIYSFFNYIKKNLRKFISNDILKPTKSKNRRANTNANQIFSEWVGQIQSNLSLDLEGGGRRVLSKNKSLTLNYKNFRWEQLGTVPDYDKKVKTHTGSLHKMKASFTTYYGFNFINMEDLIANLHDEYYKTYRKKYGNSNQGANTAILKKMMTEFHRKSRDANFGIVAYTSSKFSKNLGTSKFQGYTAGNLSLKNFWMGYAGAGKKQEFGYLISAISSTMNGAMYQGNEEQCVSLIAKQVAGFLFQDFDEIGKEFLETEHYKYKGTTQERPVFANSIHLMQLNGIYIPLSTLLFGIAKSLEKTQKELGQGMSQKKTRYSTSDNMLTIGIRRTGQAAEILYPEDSEEVQNNGYTKNMWLRQQQVSLTDIKISVSFFKNFEDFMKKLTFRFDFDTIF